MAKKAKDETWIDNIIDQSAKDSLGVAYGVVVVLYWFIDEISVESSYLE